MEIARGEIFGFLGPNGAGKTTSVKLLVGLARPSAGEGILLGRPLGDRRARQKVGYLPETFRYQDWLTAREVLNVHARLLHLSPEQAQIDNLLRTVGLGARAGSRVGSYSKGMQQRLGIAVALLGNPDLVVLDEPSSALDPLGRLEVREILRGLKAAGTTVFLNSHLLTEVEQVCDRVAFITRGRIVAQGSIEEIVRGAGGVRVRARANGTPLEPLLSEFGAVSSVDGAFLVAGVAPARVPRIVEALVRAQAEVFGIESLSASLEERFFELTGDQA